MRSIRTATLVANDSAFSPRLGVVWDVTGKQEWSVTASFANYVSALSQTIADAASPAGNPQNCSILYRGADINPAGAPSLTPTPQAIRQVFDWFFANGGTNLPLNGAPAIPEITPQIGRPQGALQPRVRRRRESAVRQSRLPARRLRVFAISATSTWITLTRPPAKTIRPVRPLLRSGVGGEQRRFDASLQGAFGPGHVSAREPCGHGRNLHPLENLGQFRRREHRKRADSRRRYLDRQRLGHRRLPGISSRPRGTTRSATFQPTRGTAPVSG